MTHLNSGWVGGKAMRHMGRCASCHGRSAPPVPACPPGAHPDPLRPPPLPPPPRKQAWYIAHRSTIVAAVRIGSASLLLVHVYLDPSARLCGRGGMGWEGMGWDEWGTRGRRASIQAACLAAVPGWPAYSLCPHLPHLPHPTPPRLPAFYSGSLLKGLAGSCALTLAANSFRNRLRFRWPRGRRPGCTRMTPAPACGRTHHRSPAPAVAPHCCAHPCLP